MSDAETFAFFGLVAVASLCGGVLLAKWLERRR